METTIVPFFCNALIMGCMDAGTVSDMAMATPRMLMLIARRKKSSSRRSLWP